LSIVFSEGLAPIKKNGKKGFIDKTGKVIIPLELEYDYINGFCNGVASVAIGKGPEIPMIKNESEEDYLKRYYALNKQRWGFIDKTGEIIIPIEYEGIRGFSEGLFIVVKDGKNRYIDNNGNVPFATDFDDLSGFYEGVARVKKENKYGYIDKTGDVVIPIVYEEAIHFKEGYAAVKKDGKYGFIDKTGSIIVPLEYDSATIFNEGLSVVKKDGKWGILQIDNRALPQNPVLAEGQVVLAKTTHSKDSGLQTDSRVQINSLRSPFKYGVALRVNKVALPERNIQNRNGRVKHDFFHKSIRQIHSKIKNYILCFPGNRRNLLHHHEPEYKNCDNGHI
jgi:hypothetical protein